MWIWTYFVCTGTQASSPKTISSCNNFPSPLWNDNVLYLYLTLVYACARWWAYVYCFRCSYPFITWWHIRCGKSNAFIMRHYFLMIHILFDGILSSWIVHVISSIHNTNRVFIHRKSSAIDEFKSKDLLAQDFTRLCVCVCLKTILLYLLPCRLKLDFPLFFHHLSFKFNLPQPNAKGLHNVHKMHKNFNERKLYHKHFHLIRWMYM